MSQPIPQTKPPSPGSEGVFLVDKPSGITSHRLVNQVRNLTGIKRVGHAGTLDPLASGLMIILVGRQFTKQQNKFLKLSKEYLCTAQFGLVTDTYDSQGQILDQASWDQIETITAQQTEQALEQFRGKIEQTVPAYSAVKQNGSKLYELARKGELEQKDLPSRTVEIQELELKKFDLNHTEKTLEITLRLTVSSGTYVRSLVHDLGKVLGVGAIVTELRRTRVGDYSITNAIKLD